MEVLFFNLSLNLRPAGLSIFGSSPRSELPSSLTSRLADLRSTALLLSSLLFFDFSLSLCARGIHGHECRNGTASVTPWTQSVIDTTLRQSKSSKKLQLRPWNDVRPPS